MISGVRHRFSHDEISKLCDELQPQIQDIPRRHLHELISFELRKLYRKQLTKEHRKVVQAFVSKFQTGEEPDPAELCDQILLGNTQLFNALPRVLVREAVQKELEKRSRMHISEKHRDLVSECVQNMSRQSPDGLVHTTEVCNQLADRIELPRHQLYQLVRRIVRSMEKRPILTEELNFVDTFVKSHSPDQLSNFSSLFEEFQKELEQNGSVLSDAPTQQRHDSLRHAVRRVVRKTISPQQKNELRDYVLAHWNDVSSIADPAKELCNQAQEIPEFQMIPRWFIQEVIHSQKHKKSFRVS